MRALIIDDDAFFRDGMVDLLRARGFDADSVASPSAARQWAEDHGEPFLAIIDHDLGVAETGFEVARWLREQHPWGLLLPIVYLTGRLSEHAFVEQLRRDGALAPTAFVSKDEIQSDPELLPQLVTRAAGQLRRIEDLAREQLVRRALLSSEAADDEHEGGRDG